MKTKQKMYQHSQIASKDSPTNSVEEMEFMLRNMLILPKIKGKNSSSIYLWLSEI